MRFHCFASNKYSNYITYIVVGFKVFLIFVQDSNNNNEYQTSAFLYNLNYFNYISLPLQDESVNIIYFHWYYQILYFLMLCCLNYQLFNHNHHRFQYFNIIMICVLTNMEMIQQFYCQYQEPIHLMGFLAKSIHSITWINNICITFNIDIYTIICAIFVHTNIVYDQLILDIAQFVGYLSIVYHCIDN